MRVRVSDFEFDDDDDMMCTCRTSRVVLHEREKRRIGNPSKSFASLREREKTERNREQNVQKYVPEQETEHQEHENGH